MYKDKVCKLNDQVLHAHRQKVPRTSMSVGELGLASYEAA